MFVRLQLLVNAGQKEVTKVGNGGRVQPSVRFLKKKKMPAAVSVNMKCSV